MKPISTTARNRASFPLIEHHYQPITLSGYDGRCAKAVLPPFRTISGQYFQREARRDFVGEAFFFTILIITAAMPMISAAYAVIELCRHSVGVN
jgi:hypothetical protein